MDSARHGRRTKEGKGEKKSVGLNGREGEDRIGRKRGERKEGLA